MRINVRFGADKMSLRRTFLHVLFNCVLVSRTMKKNLIINKRYSSGCLANILEKKIFMCFDGNINLPSKLIKIRK